MALIYPLSPDDYLYWYEKANMIFDFRKDLSELDNVFLSDYHIFYYHGEDYFLDGDGLEDIKRICEHFGEREFIAGDLAPFDLFRTGATNWYRVPISVDQRYYETGAYLDESVTFPFQFSHCILGASGRWAIAGSSFSEISILAFDQKPEAELAAYLRKRLCNVEEVVQLSYEGLQEEMRQALMKNYESRKEKESELR